ncbi:MAG: caspase family protein [Kofleriaceae bacterium]
MTLKLWFFVACAIAAGVTPASADHRVAIVVGANDPPPGHQALRFAHEDATQIAETLRRVGRFSDVRVLLDPHPADLLAVVAEVDREARATGGDSLVVFYYSGHSDGQSIFPHGEQLALGDLRDRFEHMNARIRVGILDTCRGGAWTQTKGLTVGPALAPIDLLDVTTEGTALVASSAGLENAHETDEMRGSFFTHHLTAGLLGAADRNSDGQVTLQEAFEYAKERTVRDTALLAPAPQHPSFDINLRGRQDIVLSALGSSASALEISSPRELLQVIYLATGLVIAEAPPSTSRLRLAVAPGSYIVRRVEGNRVWAKQIAVAPGATIAVTEAELELTGTPAIAVKGIDPLDDPSGPPGGHRILQLAAGVVTGPTTTWGSSPLSTRGMTDGTSLARSFDALFSFSYGITDRLTWSVPAPAMSYRFGTAGSFEVIPRAGMTSIGYSSIEHFVGTLDGGVALRGWLSPALSVIASGAVDYEFDTSTPHYRGVLTLRGDAGIAWEPIPNVILHFGAGAIVPHRVEELMNVAPLATTFSFGAVLQLGYRSLPLVQLQLSKALSLDGYASWAVDLNGNLRDRYLAGFTYAF